MGGWELEGNARCPDCRSRRYFLDWSAGDKVCTGCGLVLEAHLIDDRPEWRNFSDTAEDKSRCGPGLASHEDLTSSWNDCGETAASHAECSNEKNETAPNDASPSKSKSLPPSTLTQTQRTSVASTLIQKPNGKRSGAGTELGLEVNASAVAQEESVKRLQRVQQRVGSRGAGSGDASRDRTFAKEIKLLEDTVQKPGFTLSESMRTLASEMYVDFRRRKTVKKDLQVGAMALCVKCSTNACGAARSVEEVCNAFDIEKRTLTRARNEFLTVVRNDADMNRKYIKIINEKNGSDTSDTLTRMIMTFLPNAPRQEKMRVTNVWKEYDGVAKKHHVVGSSNPHKFALATLLVVAQDLDIAGIDAETIAKHYDVTLNTLNKHLRSLRGALEKEKERLR